MGDWGAGNDNQKAVAGAWRDLRQNRRLPSRRCCFAGDNFYNHLTGIDDPEWQNRFEKMYDPALLNFPFHAVLSKLARLRPDEWPIQLAYAKAHA